MNPTFLLVGDTEPLYELVSVKMPVLTTTGKNLWDKNNYLYEFEQGELENDGSEWNWTGASRSKQKIPCNTAKCISC